MQTAGKNNRSILSYFTAGTFVLAIFLIVLIQFSGPQGTRDTRTMGRADRSSALIEKNSARDPAVRGIPVMCYHYLREGTGMLRFARILGALVLNLPLLDDMEVWTQSVAAFEKEMEYLKGEGYRVISLDELARWRKGLLSLPPKCVALTFDDADESVYEIAFPILKKYGFRAAVFAVTSRTGDKSWQGVRVMSWDELRELYESGIFTIESHTHDLHYKVKVGDESVPVFAAFAAGQHSIAGYASGEEAIISDLIESRHLIREFTGSESRFLAWPFGFGDGKLDSLAVLAGFHGICTLKAGLNARLPVMPDSRQENLLAGDGIFAAGYDPFSSAAFDRLGDLLQERTGPRRQRQGIEIHRYTVSARTTIRSFKKMLSGELKPASY